MMKKVVVVFGLCAFMVNRQNAHKESAVMSREHQKSHVYWQTYVRYCYAVRNDYVKQFNAGQLGIAQMDLLKQTLTHYDKRMAGVIQLTKKDGFEDIAALAGRLQALYQADANILVDAIALKQK